MNDDENLIFYPYCICREQIQYLCLLLFRIILVHHNLPFLTVHVDRHEFEQALGVGDGQGSLASCSPWGHKESDTTERLNC